MQGERAGEGWHIYRYEVVLSIPVFNPRLYNANASISDARLYNIGVSMPERKQVVAGAGALGARTYSAASPVFPMLGVRYTTDQSST